MRMNTKGTGPSVQGDDLQSAAKALTSFLESRQESLVDSSIDIAKLNGYAPFTTTIRAAWVEAILSVTESLGNYLLAESETAPGPQATLDYKSDPRFTRMRLIARQHRSLGITMPMYVGLFKHFRNLYMCELGALPGGASVALAERVRDFFDETELSISADWYNSDDNLRLRELQERARAITLDKDRYFAIFESLRNPAFLLDKSHNLVNANQAAAELFLGDVQAGEIIYLRSMRQRKNSLQEAIGRILEAITEDDRSVWLESLGGPRCFDVRMRALHDAVENIAIGHVVLLNDVTEHRRATEKAQQSERGMSRFLATMSHEIRTPLHSVLGATELLRTADYDTAGTYLDLIENAGQTLLQTLNNVLDYSKLENDPPEPRPSAVNLRLAIEAFERIAAVGPNRNMTELIFEIAPDLPAHVRIDWAMTQQVLSNLVSNAIRADGGSGVTVSVLQSGATVPTLRFEVHDNGPGIAPEDAAALFRPFENANARDTGSGGAGLGLAIAHRLVEAMQGRVGYLNRESGASVWFEVPLEASETPLPDRGEPGVKSLIAPEDAPRCLLVDDDPIGSTVTARQLERLGFQVDCAATVAEASEAAGRTVFDVFVVDYILPDGDGPALVKSLRARPATGARFVALTANVEALAGSEDLSHLFDEILAKPVDQRTLSEALFAQRQSVPAMPGNLPNLARSNLEGLSPETIQAMARTFESAWEEFRQALRQGGSGAGMPDLAHQAHRLAGSTAILGIDELETPLRELERRWPERHDDDGISALLTSLDRDLTQVGSWAGICDRAGLS